MPRFEQLGIFAASSHGQPNHVLINEYQPGQGIMPHEDGAAYHPIVASVSLRAPIVLDLYKKRDWSDDGIRETRRVREGKNGEREASPCWRILQEPRSLLVTTQQMYTHVLHGIAETCADHGLGEDTVANWPLLDNRTNFESGAYERQTRISLTYRDVLKVARIGNSLKFSGSR